VCVSRATQLKRLARPLLRPTLSGVGRSTFESVVSNRPCRIETVNQRRHVSSRLQARMPRRVATELIWARCRCEVAPAKASHWSGGPSLWSQPQVLLSDVLPGFSHELVKGLRSIGRGDLANQVPAEWPRRVTHGGSSPGGAGGRAVSARDGWSSTRQESAQWLPRSHRQHP
jgi:hypothetical protein